MQIITPIHAFLKWFMGAKINVRCANVGHRWSILLDFFFNKLMIGLSAKTDLSVIESAAPVSVKAHVFSKVSDFFTVFKALFADTYDTAPSVIASLLHNFHPSFLLCPFHLSDSDEL